MSFPIFQILNYLLILVVFVILIRYTWDMIFDRDYQPAAWQQKKKQGKLSGELIKLERKFPDKVRFFNWWFQVERIKREEIRGAFAELGVYKGDSAKVLHRMDPQRKFYLFDTFKGFVPGELESETGQASDYSPSDFANTSVEKVMKRIQGNGNISVYPGIFPETASGLQNEVFSLVNIDVDLYLPTRAGLEFFYPRLSPGGIILVHDYNLKWEGVMKAVDEFVKGIPEPLIPVPDMEGTIMIMKVK